MTSVGGCASDFQIMSHILFKMGVICSRKTVLIVLDPVGDSADVRVFMMLRAIVTFIGSINFLRGCC